jgi:PKD repeat protein
MCSPTITGPPPFTVTFTDTTTNGIVTNWFWNFGDGATSNTYTTTHVIHTYTNTGTYSVAETVTGPGGTNTHTLTNLITVLTPYQAWQLQYFGCTSCSQAQPTTDADGTGQDNEFKFIAGLNPTNPASVFSFAVTQPANSPGPSLTFGPAFAGRTYTLQFETNLTSGTWQTLTNVAGSATNGSQVTITDTNTAPAAKFYRINIAYP